MSFPRYESYKDSDIEWLGEVPEHWEILALKRIASICYGIGEPPKYQIEGIPLIRATNIHSGRLFEDGLVFVNPEDIPEKRIVWLSAGDIIVVRSGAYTGDSAIIPEGYGSCIAGFDMVLRCNGATPYFVQFALLSKYLKEGQIDLEKMRAAQPHLNAEELGNSIIVIPSSREEQTEIVAFLTRETAKIDALIVEQERLIELLKEKRQAVISHSVTKGLNPNAPMKDSGIEWLGEVPEHWFVAPLKRGFDVRLGKMLQTDASSSEDELLPYLRAANIQWSGIDDSDIKQMWFSPNERNQLALLPGDLLISEGGDVGRSALWKGEIGVCHFQNSVNRVRAKGSNSNRYLYYWISVIKDKGYIDVICNKSTIAHFTAEKVQAVPMPIPPSIEQRTIADFLDRETAKIDALTAEAKNAITLLQERRTALISAAVTGKIDVRGLVETQPEREAAA